VRAAADARAPLMPRVLLGGLRSCTGVDLGRRKAAACHRRLLAASAGIRRQPIAVTTTIGAWRAMAAAVSHRELSGASHAHVDRLNVRANSSVVTTWWPARASIPVVGVAEVAFDAVQPGGMDPGPFGVVLRLRELVRGIPVAAQAVTNGAQHRRRTGRRRLALKGEDERVDGAGHRTILRER